MIKAAFIVPGKPHGKGRARAAVVNGRARLYTPKATVTFEALVRQIGAPHFAEPLTGPVQLRLVAYFEMPKSWPKRKRAEMQGQFHTQKPDADNITKAIKDSLNGVAWVDDCQVADERTVKRWGAFGEILVQIEEAE